MRLREDRRLLEGQAVGAALARLDTQARNLPQAAQLLLFADDAGGQQGSLPGTKNQLLDEIRRTALTTIVDRAGN